MFEKSTEILEYDKVLTYLSEFAVSEVGKKRCLSAEIYSDFDKIEYELLMTTQARRVYDLGENIPLNSISDIVNSLNDAKSGLRLSEEEIYAVAQTLRTSRVVRNFICALSDDFFLLKSTFNSLFVNKELEDEIFDTFDSSIKVKENATAELKRLWQVFRDTEQNIKHTASKLLQDSDFNSNLSESIYTQRDGRGVFAVKAECKNKVQGIVHDVSATNRTYFIEPKEIVALNNKLRETEVLIKAEVERILRVLTDKIGKCQESLLQAFELLVECDFLFAKAKFSAKFDMCSPVVLKGERKIKISSMKNPVLMHSKEKIVENDFELYSDKNCMIITGSNTGGKTVTLKTVGLFVLMMRAGLHLPCQSAEIYPFKNVFADIGDEQSILQNLSTFSAHMTNIKKIVDSADKESLILLDEISAGTDPNEGSSLAQSILEYLQKQGAFCIVTTHFGELKSLSFLKEGFINASVEFDVQTLSPTYKLIIGMPGASNAIAVANSLGLKKEITEGAKNLYFNHKDSSAKVLDELQKIYSDVSALKNDIKQKEESVSKLEEELKDKLDKVKQEKKKNIQLAKKRYEGLIEKARDEVREIVKEMREEKSEKVAMRSFNRLAKIETDVRNDIGSDETDLQEEFLPIDWDKVKVGDRVIIKDLNAEVEILQLPDKNKNVRVQMGIIQSIVKKDNLVVLNEMKPKPKKVMRITSKSENFSIKRHEMSQTLDLRGFRCEEAIDEVEAFLDKASLVNLSPVYIIHGHGTGALKQVVRDYLKTSPYVAKFRHGEDAEGGDGVSVVELK